MAAERDSIVSSTDVLLVASGLSVAVGSAAFGKHAQLARWAGLGVAAFGAVRVLGKGTQLATKPADAAGRVADDFLGVHDFLAGAVSGAAAAASAGAKAALDFARQEVIQVVGNEPTTQHGPIVTPPKVSDPLAQSIVLQHPPISPDNDGPIGLVNGPKSSPVVAAILDPHDSGSVTRGFFASTFPITLAVQNYTDKPQSVEVRVDLYFETALSKWSATQVLLGNSADGKRFEIPARSRLTWARDDKKPRVLDSKSRVDVGDITCVARVRVNGVQTQSTRFKVK
jgi:hypothetical protein